MTQKEITCIRRLLRALLVTMGDHLKNSGRLDLAGFYAANVAAVRNKFIRQRGTDSDAANSAAALDLCFRTCNLVAMTIRESQAGTSTDELENEMRKFESFAEIAPKRRIWTKPKTGPVALDLPGTNKPEIDETSATPPWEDAEDARLAGRK